MINLTVRDLLSLFNKDKNVEILDFSMPLPALFLGRAGFVPEPLKDRHVIRLDVKYVDSLLAFPYAPLLLISIAKEL